MTMQTYNHFIDGQYVAPIGGKWIDSIDPYLGSSYIRRNRWSRPTNAERGPVARAPSMRQSTMCRARFSA